MDERTERDITVRVEKILREMGAKEPPLKLEDVLEFLEVHRSYYSLKDPNLLQEIFHKLRIGAQKAKDLAEKIDLRGLWLPDQKRILIDSDVPKNKHRWVTAHELGHKIIPWHAELVQGDTAETLDPDYHEQIEAEANYAASSLLFLASRFSDEAADYAPSMSTVKALSGIYGNTQSSTLRRFVLHAHNKPMIALILKPHWKHPFSEPLDICRYYVPSKKFSFSFAKVLPIELINHVTSTTMRRSGGPLGGGTLLLTDDNGIVHEFVSDSFFNQYDVLTLISYVRPYPVFG